MKYYKFSKRNFFIRIFEVIISVYAAIIGPPLVVFFVICFLADLIKDFSIDSIPSFMIIVLMIVCVISSIYLLIKFFFIKRGVYLYDHCMEMKSRNSNFRFIYYSKIISIEQVGSFYKDCEANYGRYAGRRANYIGGKTGDCIKIRFNDGNCIRCCFLSVADNEKLIYDINEKIRINAQVEDTFFDNNSEYLG